jgi:hypothetical protein
MWNRWLKIMLEKKSTKWTIQTNNLMY